HLGLIYYKREEYKSAFTYMKRAAKAGHVEAMVKLGLMYKNGWGTKVKPEEAVYWWSQASDIGSAEAIEYLEGERKLQNGKSNIAANNDVCEDNSAVDEEKLTLEDFRGPESGQFNVFDEFSFGSKSDFDSFGDIEEESCSDNNMELLSSYFEEIEEMNASNVSQRDAVKNILDKIINDQKIDDWSFYPNIDSKAIVAANNNYAGRNLPFQVMGIYDDAIIPAFKGRSGIMLTSKKLIASQNINILLENIKDISIQDKVLSITCIDGSKYQYDSKKSFSENVVLEKLILAMAYIAKIYRG
ncbi:MAG: tetratricopeptide repeat protein, partial [Phascolarctobacterium sp.]